MLKKEYSYTSTPPLGLRGLFWGQIYIYLYLHRAPGLRISGAVNLNEAIPLCIYIFTLLLYTAVNTIIIEYNTNATCFDLQ